MKPNRCAWLPCRKTLSEPMVPTIGRYQFCCHQHAQLWKGLEHAVQGNPSSDDHHVVRLPVARANGGFAS